MKQKIIFPRVWIPRKKLEKFLFDYFQITDEDINLIGQKSQDKLGKQFYFYMYILFKYWCFNILYKDFE